MRRPTLILGALLGGLTSLPLLALSYFGWRLAELPFLPFDLFDWLARTLPGDVITLGIDAIVHLIQTLNLGSTSTTAKTIEQLMALGMVVLGGVVMGAVVTGLLRRDERSGWQVGARVGLVFFVAAAVIEFDLGLFVQPLLALLWLALLIVGWGASLGHWLRTQPTPLAAETDVSRRAALVRIAGWSAMVTLGAWGLGRWLGSAPKETGAAQPLTNLLPTTSEPKATPTPASPSAPMPQVKVTEVTRDQVAPASGTRLELTPTEDFYRIDINTWPVRIDGETWTLQVEGLFDHPRPLTLADLMAFPPVTQPVTMSCISNTIGGDLIGTSNWTGARLRDVLKELGIHPEAQELRIGAADGFYESVAMEDLMDPRTLLVYGMNGETLPIKHGFPLRVYIPNRYGMKQPKWITRIEAIDHEGPGYWVDRGWSPEARPQIVSVIDTIAQDEAVDGKIPIGGIAWAGDRGIQKVELQVDDGEWIETILRTPPLSPLTWVQWRYDWPAVPGEHVFRVRATDGGGVLQTEDRQRVRPNGATGYHEERATIKG